MNHPLASASSRHLVTIPMPLSSLGVRMTLAPRKRISFRRSTEKVSTITETKGYPRAAQTIASPIPVFPEVASITVNWYGSGKAGWKIKYYKGLGTSTSVEAREYFKKIQDLTVKFDMDVMTDTSIVLAFDKKMADSRKTWLLDSTAKEASELEVPYGNVKQLDITDFVHKDRSSSIQCIFSCLVVISTAHG